MDFSRYSRIVHSYKIHIWHQTQGLVGTSQFLLAKLLPNFLMFSTICLLQKKKTNIHIKSKNYA